MAFSEASSSMGMLIGLLLLRALYYFAGSGAVSYLASEDCNATVVAPVVQPARHETCARYNCPCGFKLDYRFSKKKCETQKCSWRDRDTCCIGDFDGGDRPSCANVDETKDPDGIFSTSSTNPYWPKLVDERDVSRPITFPMLREMAMDAFRGCSAAFRCEQEDDWMDCTSCIRRHCSGRNSTSGRPKAATWYPKLLSDATQESFVYQFTCDSCYLTDPGGNGNGKPGCSLGNDWLETCTSDTVDWLSSERRPCNDYRLEMKIPQLFRNSILKQEVKDNCCTTWKCAVDGGCATTTTTTTSLPLLDLSGCVHDDGCHDAFRDGHKCPCSSYVRQVMGYVPWSSNDEERKIRANCCEAVSIYENVKKNCSRPLRR